MMLPYLDKLAIYLKILKLEFKYLLIYTQYFRIIYIKWYKSKFR